MLDFFSKLFDTSDFPARWHCGAWTPGHGWLHILSDLGVWSAYVAIPLVLGYFILRRRDVPFRSLFVLFGAFIFACGTTHLMEAAIFWWPAYRLAGMIKLFTAIISWSTVVALVPITPRALAMRSPEELEREIDQRRRAEQRLEQYARELEAKNQQLIEAERLKGEFLANVSHELRTPLTLILAPVESLLAGEDGGLSDRQASDLRAVHNNAIRLLQMVTGLLDFSKLEAGKTEVHRAPVEIVALTRAIHDDFQPLRSHREVEGQFEASPAEAWVNIDRYQWERIVFNLLSNAIKFTPAGGRVTVSLAVQGDRLRLTVADTGVGIAENDLKKLFRRFGQLEGSTTRRYEGTGLGLALVKEFAELLGGSVSVSSQQGSGSTFSVECLAPHVEPTSTMAEPRLLKAAVPRYDAVSFSRTKPAADGEAELDTKPKILIAEDNSELASYISVLLSPYCETHVVRDGEEALAAIETWAPRVVLADVMMPRRDGLSLCRKIKGNPATSKTPVILLTAVTHREAMMQGWEAGADDYLLKPFHPKELRARIKSLLTAALERQRADDAMREMQMSLERLVEQRTAELAQSNAALTEADRRKDEFFAMLAHELRNPLAPISNAVQILRLRGPTTGDLPWARDVIERQVSHLTRLIDDLLDVSRINRGKLEIRKQRVALREVVEAAIEASRPLIEQFGHELTVTLPPEPVPLEVDMVRLSQALMNLLNNAAKYTPAQGHIWLTAECRTGHVVVKVRDNGIGIPPDKFVHLFDLFYQVDCSLERSQGGLGIGLSLARRVVELHGGSLDAHSEGSGRGSEFVMRLPVVEPANLASPGGDRDLELSGFPERILVVDDNRDAAESLARLLAGARHEVRTAYDGLAALEIAASFRPQVVVLDLGMPKLNGYETARKIREQPWGREITLVALTGWGQDEDRRRAQEAGFEHHLVKPATLAQLKAIFAALKSS